MVGGGGGFRLRRPLPYRKRLDGTPATPLVSQPHGQFRPDWSPHGDWITFDQEANPSNCDIYAYNPGTTELRQLTSLSNHEFEPVFSPNGQRIAYLEVFSGTQSGYRLKRIDLVGGNTDVVLVTRYTSNPAGPGILSPRWSPDGQWIYFVAGDSLYAVGADGANTGAVVPRRRLSNNTKAMHLPLGLQRIVNEIATDVSHAAVFDTTQNENEFIFYRPGAKFTNPRWSFDGTRVAYTSDQLAPGSARDIFVTQVGYNHPPTFTNPSLLQDQQVILDQAFSFQLGAGDPDGEFVTYQGAYLPPGATLSSSGLFSWPDPSPQNAEYFVVFRALDPSGGVANKVTKFTVVRQAGGGGGGGCPFAETRTASGWVVENSILGRSLTGAFATDTYRLKATPAVAEGRYQLRIRENEQEHTTLDQVQLLAVDHPADLKALAMAGRIVLGTLVPATRVTTAAGVDITKLVSGGSDEFFWGEPGEALRVETAANHDPTILEGPLVTIAGKKLGPVGPGSASGVVAVNDGTVLSSSGILFQAPDTQGLWRVAQKQYPREYWDETVVDLSGARQTRLTFVGQHKLRFVGRLALSSQSPKVQSLDLLSARHSQLGDVRFAIASFGAGTTALVPGDTLTLEFATTPALPGQVRDWFLVTRGVYTSAAPPIGSGPTGRPAPPAFALAQNQPNPFARTTTIAFALPVAATVRLEVFDLLGRRVKSLAEGEYPAGSHAVEWDRRDTDGVPVRPGVYLYRITAGGLRDQKKMVILAP